MGRSWWGGARGEYLKERREGKPQLVYEINEKNGI